MNPEIGIIGQKYQFKPGVSGNPGGRPKNSSVAKRMIKELFSGGNGEIAKIGRAVSDTDLRDLARGVVYQILNNPTVSPDVRLKAASKVWEKDGLVGTGKAQTVNNVFSISDETLAFLASNSAKIKRTNSESDEAVNSKLLKASDLAAMSDNKQICQLSAPASNHEPEPSDAS